MAYRDNGGIFNVGINRVSIFSTMNIKNLS